MKIARKEFVHPSGFLAKGFLWWGRDEAKCDNCEEERWVAKTLTEVRQDVMDFVTKLDPAMVVSISEYTTMKNLLGDDKVLHIVVWYWEEEVVAEPAPVETGPVS